MTDDEQGVLHAASEGGVSGKHSSVPPFEFRVGAATSDQFNTARFRLIPIACWRVDDIRFAFDSSFVSADLSSDAAPDDIRAELRHLLVLLKAHPGCPLSVFGHADPVGSDDYNKLLSGRRAMAIYGLLIIGTEPDHAVKLWQQVSHIESWGTEQRETMQSVSGLPKGTPDAPLFRAYMEKLCPPELKLGKKDFLAQGADSGGKGDFQGCGEFNPVLIFSQEEQQKFEQAKRQNDKPGLAARNDANALNRRVMVLIFRKGSRVDSAKWPCPRATEGVTDCRKRFWSDGEKRRGTRLPVSERKFEDTQDTFACRFYDRIASKSPCEGLFVPFVIRLVNIDYEPIAGMPYQLTVGDVQFKGVTSKEGLIVQKLPPDTTSGSLTCDGFTRELAIVPMEAPATAAGAQPRLSNLALGTADAEPGVLDDNTQLALQRFQNRHDLPTLGQLDASTASKLKDRYGS